MLKTILSIAGKPGLYKLISQGKNMLIVETVDAAKKRAVLEIREEGQAAPWKGLRWYAPGSILRKARSGL
ncbi:hypothetical protein F1891_11645, partial [Akkermansia muciniphila]